jgi:hypothetical protein
MPDADLFLGTWELVPELSLYDWGPRPAWCTYAIRPDAGGVRVEMRYAVEPGGPEQTVAFGGPADGSPQPLGGAAGGPDAFSLTRVDARTLDSAALRAGETLAHARRVASADGRLLAVVQEGPRPDGGRFRNFQVYRRAASRPAPARAAPVARGV